MSSRTWSNMEVDQSYYGVLCCCRSGNFDYMKNIMDSLKYQAILVKTVMPLVHRLKLMIIGLFSRATIKYTSKYT